MANPYIYNVVTVDGAALIAQATAANPIVYVAALSKAAAAESEADLATRPASWYDGKAGGIAAASAMGNVARVVAVWGNAGSAQPAKSLAVTARLASQSDAQAVVLTAMSDPESTIILPGADDVQGGVGVPFNVALNASGGVEVTPGAAASIADLARFVSMHKAGDPTQGDAQTVLGAKTFADGISVDYIALPPSTHRPGVTVAANIYPEDDNEYSLGIADYAWGGVRAWEVHTTSLENGLDAAPDAPIGVYASLTPYGNISLGDASHRWIYTYADTVDTPYIRTESSELNIDCKGSTTGYLSGIYLFCDDPIYPGVRVTLQPQNGSESQYNFYPDGFHAPGKNLGYANGGEWNNVYASGIASLHDIQTDIIRKRGGTGNIGLWANLVPNTTDPVSLGSTSFSFSDVYANKLHGIMPYMDGTGSTPPVGAFFLACIDTVFTGPTFFIGDVLDMSQPGVYGISVMTVAYNVDATTWTASPSWRITTGKYAVLSNGEAKTATRVICLLMRIE